MYVFESRVAPSGRGKENRIWTVELLIEVQILTLESFEGSRGRAIKYILKGLREGSSVGHVFRVLTRLHH